MNLEEKTDSYVIDNRFLDTFLKEEGTEVYTIYVNRPFDVDTLCSLHSLSDYTIMADGAVNRFYDKFLGRFKDKEIVPHAIIGDFDSIREDVLTYYQTKGVKVGQNPSQDDSDLEKCLNHLDEKIQAGKSANEEKTYKIIIAGGLGGRLDHTLNNIHLVHKFSKKYAAQNINVSLLLIDNNSIGTCILPGKTVYIKAKSFEMEKGCGFFPFLGQIDYLRTKGLRWNITEDCQPLNFEHFISSSNEMVDEVIEFETNSVLFWTTTNVLHEKQID